jgi:hypothetical protein
MADVRNREEPAGDRRSSIEPRPGVLVVYADQ